MQNIHRKMQISRLEIVNRIDEIFCNFIEMLDGSVFLPAEGLNSLKTIKPPNAV